MGSREREGPRACQGTAPADRGKRGNMTSGVSSPGGVHGATRPWLQGTSRAAQQAPCALAACTSNESAGLLRLAPKVCHQQMARGRLAGAIRHGCATSRGSGWQQSARPISWERGICSVLRPDRCRALDFCAYEVQCPHNCGKVDTLRAPHAMVWTCRKPSLSPVGMCVSHDCTGQT